MGIVKSRTFIFVLALGLISSFSHAVIDHDTTEICEICRLTSHNDDVLPASNSATQVIEQPERYYFKLSAAPHNCSIVFSDYAIRAPPVVV
ncbi:hypothetical protein [Marinicella sp. W31]|uniref:hypothetical protein n=1 Tax=Marinicella sp. W31 TaxID=3023713 RepID=UPI003758298B